MSLSSLETPITQRATVAQILGVATAVPEHSILQEDAAIVAQQLHVSDRWHNALPALYRKSGVQRRGSVLLGPEGLPGRQRQSFYEPTIYLGVQKWLAECTLSKYAFSEIK